MTVLAFHPIHNSFGRHDATGAFIPEAKEWAKRFNGMTREIDCRKLKISPAQRRLQVFEALKDCKGMDLHGIGFFCHGWRRGMQMGFNWNDLIDLAQAIVDASGPAVKVILYACNCARGDYENFASRLRDVLSIHDVASVQVDAHHGRGHTTRRPFVRRYERPAYSGGRWLVMPRTRFFRQWTNALQNKYRFDFPFRNIKMIHDELRK